MRNRIKLFAFLLFIAITDGCYNEEDIDLQDIFIDISSKPDSLVADGISRSVISVELPANIISSKRDVRFTATMGVFDYENKNTVTVNASDVFINGKRRVIAAANLISTTEEGNSIVKIKCQTYLREYTIRFVRSFADQILVAVDKLNYKPDNSSELNITVQLKRLAGRGNISTGQSINLKALDVNGNEIGIFRNKNLMIDQDGKAINFFSIPLSFGYTGPVNIIASAANSHSTQISNSLVVNVIN